MADRIIFVSENDRASYRGVKRLGDAEWQIFRRQTDSTKITLDYSNFLASGETISSVTRTAVGTTVAGTSNTTTQAIQRLTGQGYVDIAITTSDSQVRTDRIHVTLRSEDDTWPDDYV